MKYVFSILAVGVVLAAICATVVTKTAIRHSNENALAGADPSKSVAILVWNGVQIIDYTGPWEVFGRTGRKVYTVAKTSEPITTAMGMRVIPNYSFENYPKADILLIPGGGLPSSGDSPLNDPVLLKWIQDNAKDAKHVLSVCGGSLLLAKAGLLDGLEATTTAGPNIQRLKAFAPKTQVITDKRVVDNGKIVTSGGLSAGIDGALHLVSVVDGEGVAQRVALGMEYDWQPNSNYARANFADMKLPSNIYDLLDDSTEPLATKGGEESWEEKWLLTTKVSARELLDQVNEKWTADKHWLARVEKAASGANARSWILTDEKKQQWLGTASVEPSEPGKLILTLKIIRSDTGRARL